VSSQRPTDEQHALWAAFVALIEDVHAPQDQLTEVQWQAAERLSAAIPHLPPDDEQRITSLALLLMLGEIDAPDLSAADWDRAEQLLDQHTRAVEAA